MYLRWMLLILGVVLQAGAPTHSPATEDVAVWSAVVRHYSESKPEHGAAPLIILAADTVPASRITLGAVARERRIASELLERLKQQNSSPRVVAGLSIPPSVITLRGATELIRRKTPNGFETDWSVFQKRYPDSRLMQLSIPAYGDKGDKAVVYFWVGSGAEAAAGWVYLLEKEAGRWRVVLADQPWIA